MANINKIKLSGTTYNIQDLSAAKTVELTQAQYDALVNAGTIDANTFYIITDAEYFDPSNVMTSAQTESAIAAAVSGKADTSAVTSVNNALTAHTGDSTIHVTTAQTAAWNAKSDFSGSYNDLTNKPSIPSKTSDLTNDSNFTTSGYVDSQVSGKTDITSFTAHTANTDIHVTTAQTAAWNAKSDFSGSYNDLTDKPTIPTSASQLTNDVGYLVTNDITGKTDTSAFTAHTSDSDIHVTSSEKSTWNAKSDFSGSYNDLTDKPTLFSGDYNDLSNKPTIPSKTSDLTNDSNFATSGYVDSSVSGKANSSDVYTKSETSGATEIATALSGKQDTLVSGTNIKTINNESLLGSGNIDIQGGGSSYTAGDGIDITNDVISVTGKVDTTAFTAHTADTVIHVTSAEKAAWNAKSDFSGSYNDLTDKPTIPTVPTSNTAFTNDAGYITSDAISGKVDTSTFNTYSGSVETALSGKQDTLSAGTNITIVDNVISAEGGGKAVAAGTNISVTTGETADTINCTIPAFFHSNTVKGDIEIGSNDGVNSDYGRLVIGRRVQSRGNPFFQYSIGIGVQPDNSNKYCQLYGQNSVGIGRGFKIGSDSLYANGINNAIAIGHNATSRNDGDITLGADTTASGGSSVAIGSGATANGSDYKMNLNNQIKVTPSNQVYISNSANTSTYCLQEKIENTESALGGLSLVKLSQSEYDALATKDSNTLYVING